MVDSHAPQDCTAGPEMSHCWSDNIDEPVTGRTYRVCFECGHVWTRWSLRRQYRREVWGLFRHEAVGAPFDPTPFAPARALALAHIVKSWFKPASRIYFCQLCLHDW